MTRTESYLSNCLRNFREARKNQKIFEDWKQKNPEEFRKQRISVVTELRERIENAFNELLCETDFCTYIKKHTCGLKTSRVLPIEKIDPIVGHLVGERWVLAFVRSPIDMLEIQIGFLDEHNNFHRDDFVTDETFMRTLRCCEDPETLVAEIVSCFGEE